MLRGAEPKALTRELLADPAILSDLDDLYEREVQPVFDAGLVDLVETDHHIGDEISLIPTIGHTPGHVVFVNHALKFAQVGDVLAAIALVLFLIVHVAMVTLSGFRSRMRAMTIGEAVGAETRIPSPAFKSQEPA